MMHARKMMLVPAQEDYVRQMLPPAVPQLTNLDAEIKRILESNNAPADVKLQNYNQVLRRYMKLRDSEMPLSYQQDEQPRSDKLPTPPAAAPSPITAADSSTPRPELPFADDEILSGIPQKSLNSAKLLLTYVKRNRSMSWARNGEMIIGGDRISGSNIVDLVHDYSRFRKTVPEAAGSYLFGQALKNQNIPREAIGNAQRWLQMNSPSLRFLHSPTYVLTPTQGVRRTPELSEYETPRAEAAGTSTARRRLPFAWVEGK